MRLDFVEDAFGNRAGGGGLVSVGCGLVWDGVGIECRCHVIRKYQHLIRF